MALSISSTVPSTVRDITAAVRHTGRWNVIIAGPKATRRCLRKPAGVDGIAADGCAERSGHMLLKRVARAREDRLAGFAGRPGRHRGADRWAAQELRPDVFEDAGD